MADRKKKNTKSTAKRNTSAKKSEKLTKVKSGSTAKDTPKRTVKATKQAKKPEKKIETAKTVKRVKSLKPDWNYENGTGDDEKIIVINVKKAQKQKRSGRKQLKRVANIGGYTAWDARAGKTFATEKEANDYALDFFVRTGEKIKVTRTQRTVSHTFKAERKTDK